MLLCKNKTLHWHPAKDIIKCASLWLPGRQFVERCDCWDHL